MNRTSVTNVLLAVIALLLFLNLVSGSGTHAYAAGPVKYKVVSTWSLAKQKDIEKTLNQEGAEGWELVLHYTALNDIIFIFKQ